MKTAFLDANGLFSAALPESRLKTALEQSGLRFLITGDRRHFGALYGKTIQGVKIIRPRDLADL